MNVAISKTSIPAKKNLHPANNIFEKVSSTPILNNSYPSFTQGKALPHKAVQKIEHITMFIFF